MYDWRGTKVLTIEQEIGCNISSFTPLDVSCHTPSVLSHRMCLSHSPSPIDTQRLSMSPEELGLLLDSGPTEEVGSDAYNDACKSLSFSSSPEA